MFWWVKPRGSTLYEGLGAMLLLCIKWLRLTGTIGTSLWRRHIACGGWCHMRPIPDEVFIHKANFWWNLPDHIFIHNAHWWWNLPDQIFIHKVNLWWNLPDQIFIHKMNLLWNLPDEMSMHKANLQWNLPDEISIHKANLMWQSIVLWFITPLKFNCLQLKISLYSPLIEGN